MSVPSWDSGRIGGAAQAAARSGTVIGDFVRRRTIAATVGEQSAGIQQMSEAITRLAEGGKASAAATEQVEQAVLSLWGVSNQLQTYLTEPMGSRALCAILLPATSTFALSLGLYGRTSVVQFPDSTASALLGQQIEADSFKHSAKRSDILDEPLERR